MPIAERIHGGDGRTLAELWQGSPQAYLGTTVAGFPNMFMLAGPNTGLGHNSIVFMIESQLQYVTGLPAPPDSPRAPVFEVREEVMRRYNDELQRRLRGHGLELGRLLQLVHRRHGRNSIIWPGSTWPFHQRLRRFHPQEYVLRPRSAPATGSAQPAEASPAEAAAGERRSTDRREEGPHARTHEHYDVNGRTVFITGAARGIGAATAERLYAQGRERRARRPRAGAARENAARLGERARRLSRLTSPTSTRSKTRSRGAVARFGGIDVAIANAGISFTGSLATAPVEQVERTMAVNYLGVWRTDRAVIAQITERRGYLLNISSLSAIAHAPLMGPYTAAKAGVEALTNAADGDGADGRAGRLRLLRLHRHRSRPCQLRPALGAAADGRLARLPQPPGTPVQGDRRDRAGRRTALGARMGAPLDRADADRCAACSSR